MDITSFFRHLSTSYGLPHPHPRPRHIKRHVQLDSKFYDVIKLLEKERFKYVGTTIVAQAVEEHLQTPNGGGGDAFKTRPNGNLNVIGIVYSGTGDKKSYDTHFIAQLEIWQDTSVTPPVYKLTPPKYIGLKDFMTALQNPKPEHRNRSIEAMFDALPLPTRPLLPANDLAQSPSLRLTLLPPLQLVTG